jgi:hypothetical protein
MGELLNLRRARKAKARLEAEKKASANRTHFGVSRQAHELSETEAGKRLKTLEAHRLEKPEDGPN